MAKQCTVCKQSYADHLNSCPHCAEAVEVIDSGSPVEINDPEAEGVVVEMQDADAEIIRGAKKLTDSNSEMDIQLLETPPTEKNHPSSDSGFDLPLVPPGEKQAKASSAADIGLPPVRTGDSSGSDVPLGEQGPTSSGEASVVWASTVEPEGVDFGHKPEQAAFDSPSDVDLLKYVQSQEAAASPPPASLKAAPPASTTGSADPAQPSGLGLVGEALHEGELSGVVMSGTRTDRIVPTKSQRPEQPPQAGEVESGLHLAEISSTSMGEGPSGRDLTGDAGASEVDLLNRGKRIPGDDDAIILKGPAATDESAVDLGSAPDTGTNASDEPLARTDLPALSGRSLYQSESELELNVDAIEEEIDLPSHVVVTEKFDRDAHDEQQYPRESLASVAALGSTGSPVRPPSSRKGLLTGAGIGAVGGMALASIVWMSGVFGQPSKSQQNPPANSNAIPAAPAALDPTMVQNLKDQGFALEAEPKPADVIVLLLAKQTQLQNEAKANKDQADQAVKDLSDLKKKGTDTPVVDKVAADKKLKGLQDAASAAITQAKEATEKLKTAAEEAKTAKADSSKYAALLKTNAEELKAAKESANKADDKIKATEDQNKTLAAKLKEAEGQFQAANTKVAEFTKQLDQLSASRKETDAKLAEVGKRLEDAKIIGAKADQREIVKGIDRLVTLAKTTDPQGQLATAKQESQKYQAALAERHTPQEMLALWLPVLKDRDLKDNVDKALTDVDRVLKESTSPAAKAEALTVQGLALRNQGRFPEARLALEKALQQKNDASSSPSRVMAQTALKELTDPSAYYIPRVEQLQAAGDQATAVKELNEALKVFDKDKGQLLALRSIMLLEAALAKAKSVRVQSDDDSIVAARKDAQAAVAAGAIAEGNYALGRLGEETGNTEEARQSYQKALEAKADNRYRLALARVLLKLHQERTRPASKSETRTNAGLLNSTILLLDLGLAADESSTSAERDEAHQLADQILASTKDDPAGLLLKGQALAIKGQMTQALTTYIEGLRPRLKRGEVDDLLSMINSLPAVKRPESVAGNDPEQADQHYAAGLRLYAARRYADAEKEFTYAVQSFSKDARFFYYLGLSRLLAGKPGEAQDAFEEAAKLERKNLPDRATVNIAFERIQGPARREMDKNRH
jgi:tetratricopeptide (TPR) repeat protein